jgi:hypothetical protein
MSLWRYGQRVRADEVVAGMRIVMPTMYRSRVVEVRRVHHLTDASFVSIFTTGGTLWQIPPHRMVTTVVSEDVSTDGAESEPLRATETA